eukprot:TRINITY_DN7604_c0_g1_i1.p1 TRINITY_DN7604_c0_g1~~TRINITY_DN7604_c0_g1_i1.p1  ORF type:complete len:1160 (+),score=343.79 TRINITY_DN7604_c0_g1_i1:81-3482(+)
MPGAPRWAWSAPAFRIRQAFRTDGATAALVKERFGAERTQYNAGARRRAQELPDVLRWLEEDGWVLGPMTFGVALAVYERAGLPLRDLIPMMQRRGIPADATLSLPRAAAAGGAAGFAAALAELRAAGVPVELAALVGAMRALRRSGRPEEADAVWGALSGLGLRPDLAAYSTYIACAPTVAAAWDRLREAEGEGLQPRAATLGAVLAVCGRKRDTAAAEQVWGELRRRRQSIGRPGAAEWCALLAVYMGAARLRGAQGVWARMWRGGVRPPSAAYAMLVRTAANSAAAARGPRRHRRAVALASQTLAAALEEGHGAHVPTWAAAFDVYARCGAAKEARRTLALCTRHSVAVTPAMRDAVRAAERAAAAAAQEAAERAGAAAAAARVELRGELSARLAAEACAAGAGAHEAAGWREAAAVRAAAAAAEAEAEALRREVSALRAAVLPCAPAAPAAGAAPPPGAGRGPLRAVPVAALAPGESAPPPRAAGPAAAEADAAQLLQGLCAARGSPGHTAAAEGAAAAVRAELSEALRAWIAAEASTTSGERAAAAEAARALWRSELRLGALRRHLEASGEEEATDARLGGREGAGAAAAGGAAAAPAAVAADGGEGAAEAELRREVRALRQQLVALRRRQVAVIAAEEDRAEARREHQAAWELHREASDELRAAHAERQAAAEELRRARKQAASAVELRAAAQAQLEATAAEREAASLAGTQVQALLADAQERRDAAAGWLAALREAEGDSAANAVEVAAQAACQQGQQGAAPRSAPSAQLAEAAAQTIQPDPATTSRHAQTATQAPAAAVSAHTQTAELAAPAVGSAPAEAAPPVRPAAATQETMVQCALLPAADAATADPRAALQGRWADSSNNLWVVEGLNAVCVGSGDIRAHRIEAGAWGAELLGATVAQADRHAVKWSDGDAWRRVAEDDDAAAEAAAQGQERDTGSIDSIDRFLFGVLASADQTTPRRRSPPGTEHAAEVGSGPHAPHRPRPPGPQPPAVPLQGAPAPRRAGTAAPAARRSAGKKKRRQSALDQVEPARWLEPRTRNRLALSASDWHRGALKYTVGEKMRPLVRGVSFERWAPQCSGLILGVLRFDIGRAACIPSQGGEDILNAVRTVCTAAGVPFAEIEG